MGLANNGAKKKTFTGFKMYLKHCHVSNFS